MDGIIAEQLVSQPNISPEEIQILKKEVELWKSKFENSQAEWMKNKNILLEKDKTISILKEEIK